MRAPPERFHLPLLLLAVLLLFVPPAGLHDWWYPDEPDVALPALEMAARGDWVVPTHNGVAWLDYPPLSYWASRIGAGGGAQVGALATRWPLAVFACIFLAATVLIGRALGQGRMGLVAGVMLLATPTLWFHASNLQVDLGYAMAIAFGLWCYVVGDAPGTARGVWWRIAGFACFGVAILGKGPLGVLLPGLILFVWHAWNREWRKLLLLAPLALVSLAVALPWYLLLINRLGSDFVIGELLQQNFDRFGASKRGHGGKGFFYYFLNFPPDLGLWIALLLPALWSGFRMRREDRNWRLLAVWLLAPFIFFTFASTKRNVYLLPAFPAMVLLISDWFVHGRQAWEERWRQWSLTAIAATLLLIGVVVFGAGFVWSVVQERVLERQPAVAQFMQDLQPMTFIFGLWLVAAAVAAWWQGRCQALAGWLTLGIATTIGYALALWLVFPLIDQVRTFRPAAQWLAQRVPAQGTVGFYLPGREAPKRPAWLCHMGDGRRLVFFTTPEDAGKWLAEDQGRLLLSDPARGEKVPGAHEVKRWFISSDYWVVLGKAP